MNHEKKLKALNDLLGQIQLMKHYERGYHTKVFLAEAEVVLKKFFGEDSIHVKKFNKVIFKPQVLANDTNSVIIDKEIEAFESGKTEMKILLKGAIKELELDTESLDSKSNTSYKNNKIFIVHGHDSGLKNEVARFVETLGFEAVILHEKANEGNTIIEKIEKNSDVGFAIVLYTPCDDGKAKTSEYLNSRARQNVVFEHGYFIAKLGRKKVVALHKGDDIELPNDISGVIYIKYEDGTWKRELADEMDESGYQIDYKLVR